MIPVISTVNVKSTVSPYQNVKFVEMLGQRHLASVDPRVLTEGSQANLHYHNVSAWVPMTLGDVSQRTRALDRGGDGDRFVTRDRRSAL